MAQRPDVMTTVSVALITRNQARFVGRLVESVLQEGRRIDIRDIVVADSASSDDTVAIARRYPVTVVRLSENLRLTAAAGRFVAGRFCSGDYVLYLDGDMQLCAGWLSRAVDYLDEHADVAVVSGTLVDVVPGETPPSPPTDVSASTVSQEVRHGGGAALYRRAVVEAVGDFRPDIYSDEEPELCLRIRQAGYRVVRLRQVIAYHFSDSQVTLAGLIKRRRRKLFLGTGQNLRRSLGSRLFARYMIERGFGLPMLFVCGIAAVALAVYVTTGVGTWLIVCAILMSAWFVLVAIRKRSMNAAVCSLVNRLLMAEGTLRGLWLPSIAAPEYLRHMTLIQSSSEKQDAQVRTLRGPLEIPVESSG